MNPDPVPPLFRLWGAYRSSGVSVAVRLFLLIRQGQRPCHLPRRGRLPPAGAARKENPLLTRRVWGGTGMDLVPPLIRPPTRRTVYPGLLWPSGCFPSSVRARGPATFPAGEGDLPAGAARKKTLSLRDGCGTKPSPGRGWLGEAETGVGRCWVGPGTAPLPALRDVPFIRDFCGRQVVSPHPSGPEALPPSPRGKATSRRGLLGRKTLSLRDGCGTKPSPGRGWQGEALTDVEEKPSPGRREWGGTNLDPVPPLIRPCGATFPQGKVGVKNCTP